MATDSVLVNRLRQILKDSDLETTTSNTVRRRLEEEFAVDLHEHRALIIKQIELFLQSIEAQNDVVEQEKEEEELNENSQNQAALEKENGDEEENRSEHEQEEEQRGGNLKKRKKSGSTNMKSNLKKKGLGGFCLPCGLSPQLQEFLGVPELARTEVVKKLWSYIQRKNLQNPKDKRTIICDESLRRIFRVKSIHMFQMNKALSDHIWSLNKATHIKSSQKERQHKQRREVGSDEPKRKVKPVKGGCSGITAPVPLSNALIKFFGTGEHELSRAQIVKKMWQYIKENELQDPSDKKMVLCDDKLKELLEVDSFKGFTVLKLLTSHFIKPQE